MYERKEEGGEERDTSKTYLNILCFINFTLEPYYHFT